MLLTACCLVFFGTALADQVGNKRWCNSDQYGCWVTGSGGGQNYIMFWSEDSRAYFMGGQSKPGELVTDKPNTTGGRLGMQSAPQTKVKSWRDIWVEVITKHGDLLESQGNNISELIKNTLEDFEKKIANGVETEEQVISSAKAWDKAYTDSENMK